MMERNQARRFIKNKTGSEILLNLFEVFPKDDGAYHIIYNKLDNREEHPIAFASKTITSADTD